MKRNAKLDGLRFLYAVPVFLLHSMNFHTKGYIFPGGALAVEFFLIMSGYLMAVSIDKKYQRGGSRGSWTGNLGVSWEKAPHLYAGDAGIHDYRLLLDGSGLAG